MLADKVFLICALTLVAGVYIAKEECPPNEEYQLCGSSCPFNCSSPEGPVTCSEDCVEGCFCKAGFLRAENGTCVSADVCTGGNKICSANEEFLSCGSACPLTCAQPEGAPCGVACSVGCFCKAGFVRDQRSNECVTVDKCPVEQCFNPDEVYSTCNAECESSCVDPEPICTNLCKGGCVCADGLLRNDNGTCVSVDKCQITNSTDPGLLGKYINMIQKVLDLSIE